MRWIFFLVVLIAASGMGVALYSQHVLALEPCPLCIFQRVALIAVGLVALLAWLHSPRGTGLRIYSFLAFLCASAGAAIAGRHVYLQHLPADEVPECGPGLEFMLEAFPFADVLSKVFSGSGECAEIDWVLLGFSMPEWTLVLFAGLSFMFLVMTLRRTNTYSTEAA